MQKPITDADYKQIFQVLYSLIGSETEDLTNKCYHFNILGCMLLSEFYQIEAHPVVGIAGYCLGGSPVKRLIYGEEQYGTIRSDGEQDHCWVITEEWHIDFMAPLFPEILVKGDLPACERKIMMKHASEAKDSLDDLLQEGDYFVSINPEKTERRMRDFLDSPYHRSLATICNFWFKKPPCELRESIPIKDQDGQKSLITLKDLEITGSY